MEELDPINRHSAGFITRTLTNWHRFRKLLQLYWWIPVACLAVCLVLQWLWLRYQPPTFMSAGRMIVNVKLSIPSANTYSEELDNFFGTQVKLMESDSVINRVDLRLRTEHPELPPSRVAIQVNVVPKTSIFNLQAIGVDSRYTQAYLTATMEEYIKLKKDLLANASSSARSSIQEELRDLAGELQGSKQAYLDFQSSNSIVLLQENGGNSVADYLSTLTKKLAEEQSEWQLLNSLTLDENLARQQEAIASPGSLPPPVAGPSGSPNAPVTSPDNTAGPGKAPASLGAFETDYLQTRQQILILKARRDDLARVLKPKHPDIIAINDEIASQERLLDIFQNQSQDQLKSQRHTLEVQIQDLQNQIDQWQKKAIEASSKLADYEVLKENYQRQQAMYDQLQVSLQTLDVDRGIGQESVTILEPATPALPLPKGVSKLMIMAALIGLMGGLSILILINRLDDRPASFHELEALFDRPVLAQFPLIKPADKKSAVPVLQSEDERYMLVEAYQNLRSALVYQHVPASHPRSIVVTSASPHEGKSMISANFAITLAQSGARVLLVDADLRRGNLHRHFGVPSQPGLAEVLGQHCEWSHAVVPTAISNLSLLPCGTYPRRPGSLFAMQTSKFLAAIAGQYDYYIFDTAPVMAADDISSLAPHVDGLIMVIRAGFTSGRIAQAALDLLELRKVNVIGLVFNAVQTGSGGYEYYRNESYYPRPLADQPPPSA